MSTKRVLAIHDLCSFGRCSLTAAIPIISAMGFQVCPLPTALFSNNLTYPSFISTDCTKTMPQFINKWEELNYTYNAIYSGFLGDISQINLVEHAIDRLGANAEWIIVDPAMGDNGKLYPIFTPEIVPAMRKLIQKATLITPNYTEATLLSDIPYKQTEIPTSKKIKEICQKLSYLGPKKVIITSIPDTEKHIKIVCYDHDTMLYDEYTVKRIPFSTCGTGDIFTSIITGSLLNGMNLFTAIKTAADFLSEVITYTYEAKTDYREGIQLEPHLHKLWNTK
ncbi:pyridoxamine kinase [Veillonellaceae bacterium M2-4]|jgi:hypothetical protein|nr:pyridoxamine kinase [Veillonellaceae bacterium M2-4]